MSSHGTEWRLVLRERRASLEQALLNRAFRADKGVVDRLVTRVVARMVPKVAPEPGRSKTVDSVAEERRRPRRTGVAPGA